MIADQIRTRMRNIKSYINAAATCFFIASKIEDVQELELEEVACATGLPERNIRAMELSILTDWETKLYFKTPLDYIENNNACNDVVNFMLTPDSIDMSGVDIAVKICDQRRAAFIP
jgi:hypothetical protein